ncbi:MAG: sigma factor-like helix-turn-helix DNA-binding protein, partial [Actinomycetes bacterium]
ELNRRELRGRALRARAARCRTGVAGRVAVLRCGEGARFDRTVASADEEHTAWKLQQVVSGDSFDLADHLDKIALVKRVNTVLTTDEQRLFDLVFVKGLSVTEVAKMVGLRRETVSRKLSDAKKRARKAIGPAS